MDSTNVATIVLKVNGQDAQKTIDNIEKRLKMASDAKDKLDQKYRNGGDWSKADIKAYQSLTREVNRCNRELDNTQATAERVKKVMANLSGAGIVELKQSHREAQTEHVI